MSKNKKNKNSNQTPSPMVATQTTVEGVLQSMESPPSSLSSKPSTPSKAPLPDPMRLSEELDTQQARQKQLDEWEQRLNDLEKSLKSRENEVFQREQDAREDFVTLKQQLLAEFNLKREGLLREYEELPIKIEKHRQELQRQLDGALKARREAEEAYIENEAQRRKEQQERELNEACERHNNALRQERDKLEARQKEFAQQQDELNERATELRQKESQLRGNEEDLKFDKEELENERNRIDTRVEQRAQAQIKALEVDLQRLRQQQEEWSALLKQKEDTIDDYKELHRRFQHREPEEVLHRQEELERENIELRQKLSSPSPEMNARLEEAIQEKELLEHQLYDIRRELCELRGQLVIQGANVGEVERLREEVELRDRQIRHLEDLYKNYRQLYEGNRSEADRNKRIGVIEQPMSDWMEFEPKSVRKPTDDKRDTELIWLDTIREQCHESGLSFPKRILYAFHTALKTAEWSPITILAGVSGTGKSELPRLYARFGGLLFESLAVQPDWDSPQSMFGFFNSVDNHFNATDLLRRLVQSQKSPQDNSYKHGTANCVFLVLLDEMNLAHVELYFSDLLSKLELRRGEKSVSINIDLGAGIDKYPLSLGRNVLWTGTMNQDETTKTLSDKVLDRGNMISFPRPHQLQRRIKIDLKPPRVPLPYSEWKGWLCQESPFSDEEVNPYMTLINGINDDLENVGRALGHRVWQSIEHYMANYPTVRLTDKERDPSDYEAAMRMAFEDQLVQKVMPKLRGIETTGISEKRCLIPIRERLEKFGLHLTEDFKLACQTGHGYFHWNSAKYIGESDG